MLQMKKLKNKLKVTLSKTPPPGWPSESDWKLIEDDLKKKPASRIIPISDLSPSELVKKELCAEFIRYIKKNKMKQKDLAAILRVTESRMSEILHYYFDHYTIDRLLELLIIIKPDARLKIVA